MTLGNQNKVSKVGMAPRSVFLALLVVCCLAVGHCHCKNSAKKKTVPTEVEYGRQKTTGSVVDKIDRVLGNERKMWKTKFWKIVHRIFHKHGSKHSGSGRKKWYRKPQKNGGKPNDVVLVETTEIDECKNSAQVEIMAADVTDNSTAVLEETIDVDNSNLSIPINNETTSYSEGELTDNSTVIRNATLLIGEIGSIGYGITITNETMDLSEVEISRNAANITIDHNGNSTRLINETFPAIGFESANNSTK